MSLETVVGKTLIKYLIRNNDYSYSGEHILSNYSYSDINPDTYAYSDTYYIRNLISVQFYYVTVCNIKTECNYILKFVKIYIHKISFSCFELHGNIKIC